MYMQKFLVALQWRGFAEREWVSMARGKWERKDFRPKGERARSFRAYLDPSPKNSLPQTLDGQSITPWASWASPPVRLAGQHL